MLFDIQFVNNNTGYACGEFSTLIKTTNGGNNWFLLNNYGYTNRPFLHIKFIDENTGLITGPGGLILKTTNGGGVFISKINQTIPDNFILYQNYPNPFNPTTKIKFDIPPAPLQRGERAGMTIIKVYDILGKEVETLVNENLSPGTYEVTFDGTKLPSGIYFARLISGKNMMVKKMILLK
jgi:hypothetical protein